MDSVVEVLLSHGVLSCSLHKQVFACFFKVKSKLESFASLLQLLATHWFLGLFVTMQHDLHPDPSFSCGKVM